MKVQSVKNYAIARNYRTAQPNQKQQMPNQQSFGRDGGIEYLSTRLREVVRCAAKNVSRRLVEERVLTKAITEESLSDIIQPLEGSSTRFGIFTPSGGLSFFSEKDFAGEEARGAMWKLEDHIKNAIKKPIPDDGETGDIY